MPSSSHCAAEALGCGQDHYHVEPLIDGAKENMAAIGHAEDCFAEAILTADTAYHVVKV